MGREHRDAGTLQQPRGILGANVRALSHELDGLWVHVEVRQRPLVLAA